jgi:CRISPR/Cas system-associated protein endoribonuclease Cas2
MDFSKDKFMRMLVFFDLPVKTKEMMKQANKFRKTLLDKFLKSLISIGSCKFLLLN